MKNNTCLLLVLMLPILGFSQGVKANLFDKFLKKQRIEMEPVKFTGLSGNNELAIEFSAIGSTLYFNLRGIGWGASTVDKGNQLVLQFSEGQSRTLKAASLQSFEHNLMQNIYRHQYILQLPDLNALAKSDLTGLRKYSFDAYSDLTLPSENKENIKRMSALFLTAVKNANITSTANEISVKDVRQYIGDSITFCSKVYRTRYFQGSEDGPTLLDVQADFSDPFVNVVILEKDRHKFAGNPETTYLNKDVCISGVVRLRNNVPYLVLQEKAQLKLNNTGEAVKKEVTANVKQVAKEGPQSSSKETLAEFLGGPAAFLEYLEKNLVHPDKTKSAGERQVIAAFEIDAQGNCNKVKIVASAGLAFDAEVKRVLSNMPKWKPAFSNGRFVATQITQPIRFKGTQPPGTKGA